MRFPWGIVFSTVCMSSSVALAQGDAARRLHYRQETMTTTSSSAAPASTAVPYGVKTPPLDTPWTYNVGTDPWPEYPRPQLRRDAWKSLNGIWTYQAATGPDDLATPPSGLLGKEVMIPSCIESGLSGLQELNVTFMWFATKFNVPEGWGKEGRSILLNFEAVDYDTTVFINGIKLGGHVGGYFRFTIDATKHVNYSGENVLTVFVHDPTDLPGSFGPIGKQTKNPSHIFYRSCSGIWQTVWLENTPSNHITQLDVAADMNGKVTVTVHSSKLSETPVTVSVLDERGNEISRGSGISDSQFTLSVAAPRLWSPESPNLYNLTVTMGNDTVSSYTGFRTISRGMVDGVQRPLLNGEFVFLFGTLDQGFWPDGLYMPPNREAMIWDLKLLKRLGMNMVRKHIKIEPDLFYHACDHLGLLVIQDMPSMSADGRMPSPEQQEEFGRQLGLMVKEHRNYPSIVTWVIYNEGWAQLRDRPYPEERLTEVVRGLDPTRLIISASGWADHGFGDFSDNHHYATPQCGTPFYSRPSGPHDPSRIGFQGEFGGIGHNVSVENLWKVQHAIDEIDRTYELAADLKIYNYRGHTLLSELKDQISRFECSGAVYTQTTDVEGEVNGLVTYDRRLIRADEAQWRADIEALYDAAAGRGGRMQMRGALGSEDQMRLM